MDQRFKDLAQLVARQIARRWLEQTSVNNHLITERNSAPPVVEAESKEVLQERERARPGGSGATTYFH